MGRQFLAHDDATVTTVVDIDEEIFADAGDELSVESESRYTDYRMMLEAEQADAVLIGTRYTLHYDQICSAFEQITAGVARPYSDT